MPDETPPAGTATPATPAATAPAAATPPAAVTPPTAPETLTLTNAQLTERLDRAKRAALQEAGITDPTKAKALLDAATKAEEEAKSAAQRLGETSTKLTAAEAELARHRASTATFAKEALAPLSDAQRAQVTAAIAAAGGNPEDPATQIGMVAALRPGWATATPATTPAAAATTPAAATPATTAPAAGSAPAPGTTTAPTDHKAVYKELEKSNPVAAANYLSRHQREIYPAQ